MIVAIDAIADTSCRDLFISSYSDIYHSDDYQEAVRKSWSYNSNEVYAAYSPDKTMGSKKIKALSILGYRKINGVFAFPNYEIFVKNFIRALNLMKVPTIERLLPAVVFVREVDKKKEFLFVVPGIDPWPVESGFRIYNSRDGFNLPNRIVLMAMKNGRFPLLDGLHDTSHFVSFLLNPKYMRAIRRRLNSIEDLEKVNKIDDKMFFINELITMGNPEKRNLIDSILICSKIARPNQHLNFQEVLSKFKELPTTLLLDHGTKLIEEYDRLLIDFGGGSVGSWEKNRTTDFRQNGIISLITFIEMHPSKNIDKYSYFESLSTASSTLKNLIRYLEMPVDDFSWYADQMVSDSNKHILLIPHVHRTLRPDYKDVILEAVRLHIARMEFGLWESVHGIDVERVVNGLIAVGNPDPEVIEWLQVTLGKDSRTFQSFFH